MLALYWLVRIYMWVIIAWVLMSWIPVSGVNQIRALLGIVVEPVVAPFRFLSLGPVSLAPIVPLFILSFLEHWLGRQVGAVSVPEDSAATNPDGTVDVIDLQPAPVEEAEQHRG